MNMSYLCVREKAYQATASALTLGLPSMTEISLSLCGAAKEQMLETFADV